MADTNLTPNSVLWASDLTVARLTGELALMRDFLARVEIGKFLIFSELCVRSMRHQAGVRSGGRERTGLRLRLKDGRPAMQLPDILLPTMRCRVEKSCRLQMFRQSDQSWSRTFLIEWLALPRCSYVLFR